MVDCVWMLNWLQPGIVRGGGTWRFSFCASLGCMKGCMANAKLCLLPASYCWRPLRILRTEGFLYKMPWIRWRRYALVVQEADYAIRFFFSAHCAPVDLTPAVLCGGSLITCDLVEPSLMTCSILISAMLKLQFLANGGGLYWLSCWLLNSRVRHRRHVSWMDYVSLGVFCVHNVYSIVIMCQPNLSHPKTKWPGLWTMLEYSWDPNIKAAVNLSPIV